MRSSINPSRFLGTIRRSVAILFSSSSLAYLVCVCVPVCASLTLQFGTYGQENQATLPDRLLCNGAVVCWVLRLSGWTRAEGNIKDTTQIKKTIITKFVPIIRIVRLYC